MDSLNIQDLPIEMLVEILSFLPLIDLKEASLVCRNWYDAIFHPKLLKGMVLSLNKSNYNEYNANIKKRHYFNIKFWQINFDENYEDIRVWQTLGLNLELLAFKNCTFTVNQVLSIIQTKTNLKTLKFEYCDFKDPISLFKVNSYDNILKYMTKLKFNNIDKNNIELFNILIRMMPNLEILKIHEPFHTETKDAVLKNLKKRSKTLNSIYMYNESNIDFVTKVVEIESLKLKKFNVDTELSQMLIKKIKTNQQSITELILFNCKESSDLITVCNAMPNLIKLVVDSSSVLENETVKDLWKLKSLKSLNISFCSINNISANAFITGLKDENDNLELLIIYLSSADNLLMHISNKFPNLRELYISCQTGVKENEIQNVWKNLHNLRKFSLDCYDLTMTDYSITGKLSQEQNEKIMVSHSENQKFPGYSIARIKGLKDLTLNMDSSITVASLNEIVKLKELISLNLSFNKSEIEMDDLQIFNECKLLEDLTITLKKRIVDKSKTTRKMLKNHFRQRLKKFKINKDNLF